MNVHIVELTIAGKYAVQFPFALARKLTGLEQPKKFRVGALEGTIARVRDEFVITFSPFNSEQGAQEFVARIWESLAVVSLRRGIGFSANIAQDSGTTGALQPIKAPSVFDVGVVRVQGYMRARLEVSTSAEIYLQTFLAVVEERDGNTFADTNIRTAMELFSSTELTQSYRIKLLSCITALEVLMRPQNRPPAVVKLLEEMIADLRRSKAQHQKGSAERKALECIVSELGTRKQESNREGLQRLVEETFCNASEEEMNKSLEDIAQAYRVRNKLTHSGRVNEAEIFVASTKARDLLRKVLAKRFGIDII